MDFDIPQKGNTRFIYMLPVNSKEALVEYTVFSKQLLDYSSYESGIKSYLDRKGITNYTTLRKEQGVIPMTCYPFTAHNSLNILNKNGCRVIAQPNGSINDYKIISFSIQNKISLYFIKNRLFKH